MLDEKFFDNKNLQKFDKNFKNVNNEENINNLSSENKFHSSNSKSYDSSKIFLRKCK